MTSELRIASLLPSATEIVCALGAQQSLVARSHECDFPIGIESTPVLTRPRKALSSASGDIDRTIRSILQDATTVYDLDVDGLRDAAPDVIVTQDLCDVCAVSLDDVSRALAQITDHDVTVVSLKPKRLSDVWNDIRAVGCAIGCETQAAKVADDLAERCDAIAQRARGIGRRPSVLTIEWMEPVMVGGTWMPELVEMAGGSPLVTQPGQHAPTLSLDALRALDPTVVLVKPCGFTLARTRAELHLLHKNLPWNTWRAVSERRVFVADGNAFFNRSGPRLVESLEILAACIHTMSRVLAYGGIRFGRVSRDSGRVHPPRRVRRSRRTPCFRVRTPLKTPFFRIEDTPDNRGPASA